MEFLLHIMWWISWRIFFDLSFLVLGCVIYCFLESWRRNVKMEQVAREVLLDNVERLILRLPFDERQIAKWWFLNRIRDINIEDNDEEARGRCRSSKWTTSTFPTGAGPNDEISSELYRYRGPQSPLGTPRRNGSKQSMPELEKQVSIAASTDTKDLVHDYNGQRKVASASPRKYKFIEEVPSQCSGFGERTSKSRSRTKESEISLSLTEQVEKGRKPTEARLKAEQTEEKENEHGFLESTLETMERYIDPKGEFPPEKRRKFAEARMRLVQLQNSNPLVLAFSDDGIKAMEQELDRVDLSPDQAARFCLRYGEDNANRLATKSHSEEAEMDPKPKISPFRREKERRKPYKLEYALLSVGTMRHPTTFGSDVGLEARRWYEESRLRSLAAARQLVEELTQPSVDSKPRDSQPQDGDSPHKMSFSRQQIERAEASGAKQNLPAEQQSKSTPDSPLSKALKRGVNSQPQPSQFQQEVHASQTRKLRLDGADLGVERMKASKSSTHSSELKPDLQARLPHLQQEGEGDDAFKSELEETRPRIKQGEAKKPITTKSNEEVVEAEPVPPFDKPNFYIEDDDSEEDAMKPPTSYINKLPGPNIDESAHAFLARVCEAHDISLPSFSQSHSHFLNSSSNPNQEQISLSLPMQNFGFDEDQPHDSEGEDKDFNVQEDFDSAAAYDNFSPDAIRRRQQLFGNEGTRPFVRKAVEDDANIPDIEDDEQNGFEGGNGEDEWEDMGIECGIDRSRGDGLTLREELEWRFMKGKRRAEGLEKMEGFEGWQK